MKQIAACGYRIGKRRKAKAQRRFWLKPGRCSGWWSNLKNRLIEDDEEWRLNFPMLRNSFDLLSYELHPYIEKQVTNMRISVSVETQVAVALYFLSDGGRMKKIANSFALATCTVAGIIKRLVQAISNTMKNNYLKPPITEGEVIDLAAGCYSNHGFPQSIGAVDGTHIPIKIPMRPQQNSTDFVNRKGKDIIV